MRHPDPHQVIHTGGAPRPAWRRAAFTLTELVVSVGILSLMMAMVGTVFKLTIDSTGQATSLTEITQLTRLLEETLRRDLATVAPASSIMVIEARAINAYWRTEYRELDPDRDPFTGYPHDADPEREIPPPDAPGRPPTGPALPRADVLMFFTGRQTISTVCDDVESKLAQVVYGHAEIGELDSAGAWVGGTPTTFTMHPNPPAAATVFPDAAETWHLARRSVLIVDGVVAGACADSGLVQFALDRVGPANWPDELLNSQHDVVGKDPADIPGSFDFLSDVVGLTSLGTVELPDWFARSRLDLTPAALQATRLGAYLLPHCASFKVEWALDLRDFVDFASAGTNPPRELVWLDPGRVNASGLADPLGELSDLVTHMGYTGTVATAIDGIETTLLTRFAGAPTGISLQTPVWFGNDAPNGGSLGEPDRYFPKALRITVDVYDDSGRFRRPIRQVMVLPVGGG